MLAEFTKLVRFVNAKFSQAAEAIGELRDVVINYREETDGHLAEFGEQLFGIHVIQEILCEKAGIPIAEVEARRDAKIAALREQQRLLEEKAAKAREEAEAEKVRQKEAPAMATGTPATAEETSEAPAPGTDVNDHAG